MVTTTMFEPRPSELMELLATIMRVSKTLRTTLWADLEARHGLTIYELDVLSRLLLAPDGLARMHQISDALATDRTSVTRVVDGLEAKGLVERRRRAGDRRAVYAAITGVGRGEFLRIAPLVDEEARIQLGDEISEQEAAQMRAGLSTILLRLGKSADNW